MVSKSKSYFEDVMRMLRSQRDLQIKTRDRADSPPVQSVTASSTTSHLPAVTSRDEMKFKSTLDNVDMMVDKSQSSGELGDVVRQVLRENDRFGAVDFERLQEELSTGERGRRRRERKQGGDTGQAADSAIASHSESATGGPPNSTAASDDRLRPYLLTPEDPSYSSSVHPLYKTVMSPPGPLGLVIGRVTRQKMFEGYESGDEVSSATPWDDLPGVFVFSVQSNSPLKGGGVVEGDRIVDINGVSVIGLTTREVTKVLRNTAGTEREIGFLEAWTGQNHDPVGEADHGRGKDELSTVGSM